jgi:hypothetical protein
MATLCNWDNVGSPEFDGCNGCDGRGCSLVSAPSTLRVFPCDMCGEQIDDLRLIKWRENGKVIRFWVCKPCWKQVYHSEEGG